MKAINDLVVVLTRTINNPNTTEDIRKIAKEALHAVQETKNELNDERTKEEATNRIWRTFGSTKYFTDNEEKI